MVKTCAIPHENWDSNDVPLTGVPTFKSEFVEDERPNLSLEVPAADDGYPDFAPLPVLDWADVPEPAVEEEIIVNQPEPEAPLPPVVRANVLEALRMRPRFGLPPPSDPVVRPRAPSFELIAAPEDRRELQRDILFLGKNVLGNSVDRDHFKDPPQKLIFMKELPEEPTLRMAELRMRKVLQSNETVLDFLRRQEYNSGNFVELKQFIDFHFRSKNTKIVERAVQDLSSDRTLYYINFQVTEYNYGVFRKRWVACAPTSYVKIMYGAIGTKENPKSIEIATAKACNDNPGLDGGLLEEAGLIAEYMRRCKRARAEGFRSKAVVKL